MARVNSFITKGSGTWGKADKDLADKVRGEAVSPEQQAAIAISKKKRASEKSVKEWFESNATRAKYQLQHGDDWWWKMNEVHDKMLEKNGDCCEDCITEQGGPEHEVTVGNYTTTHFYMCGSAQKVMRANKDKPNVESLTSLQDDMFKLEKQLTSLVAIFAVLFAFSTENWSRPKTEVSGLMSMLREVIDIESKSLHKLGARIIHMGRRDRIDPDLLKAINNCLLYTSDAADE